MRALLQKAKQLVGATLVRLVRNISWLLFEKLVRLLSGFVIGIFIARYLGPAGNGSIQYAKALLSFMAIGVTLGLHLIVIRELVNRPKEKQAILGSAFCIEFVGAIVVYAAIGVFSLFTSKPGSEDFWVVLLICAALLFLPFEVLDYYFESNIQSHYSAMRRIIAVLAVSAYNIVLLILRAPLLAFAVSTFAEAAISGILILVFYQKKYGDLLSWRPSWPQVKHLLGQTWIMFLSGIAITINLKVDQLLLRWMIGKTEIGIYAVAALLSEAWYFVAAAVVLSLNPLLIRLKKNNPERYGFRLQQVYDFLFLLALCIAIVLNLIAGPVIRLLYGEAYIGAAQILSVHIWAGLFVFMRELFGKWLIIEGLQLYAFLTNCVGAIVNIIMNLLLIPGLGGMGAAIATLISYASSGFLSLLFFPKTRPAARMMILAMISPFRYAARAITGGKGKPGAA
jgi:O-antigen/teichoic acid export membrane protein